MKSISLSRTNGLNMGLNWATNSMGEGVVPGFDSINISSDLTVTGGGYAITRSNSNGWDTARSLVGKSTGLWYAEFTWYAGTQKGEVLMGILDSAMDLNNYIGAPSSGQSDACLSTQALFTDTIAILSSGGATQYNGVSTFPINSGIKLAIDAQFGRLWAGVIGQGWIGGGDPATLMNNLRNFTPSANKIHLGVSVFENGAAVSCNFGQSSFIETPPTGFLPWGSA